jgi:hypothetical protein
MSHRRKGPYRSPFDTDMHYLVPIANALALVREGQSPNEGMLFPSAANAMWWIKENGFEQVEVRS